jgi:integrase
MRRSLGASAGLIILLALAAPVAHANGEPRSRGPHGFRHTRRGSTRHGRLRAFPLSVVQRRAGESLQSPGRRSPSWFA